LFFHQPSIEDLTVCNPRATKMSEAHTMQMPE
jgi:hypothetical protein